jgi:transcriptional regulator NrdR family protein
MLTWYVSIAVVRLGSLTPAHSIGPTLFGDVAFVLKCASIFTSTEHPDLPASIMVLRPDNLLEPFNRDKLFLSIYKSCEHRPKAIEDATALTQIISTHLLASPTSGKLALNTITTTALTVLGRYDKTAATVYSAYYT